jgi:hypothetical protein
MTMEYLNQLYLNKVARQKCIYFFFSGAKGHVNGNDNDNDNDDVGISGYWIIPSSSK